MTGITNYKVVPAKDPITDRKVLNWGINHPIKHIKIVIETLNNSLAALFFSV